MGKLRNLKGAYLRDSYFLRRRMGVAEEEKRVVQGRLNLRRNENYVGETESTEFPVSVDC